MQNIFWKSTVALSAIALLGNMVNAEAEVKVEDHVLVLDDTNFDEQIKKHNEGLLVEFYAPWCGHCKSLAPEYAAAAKNLSTKTPPRFLAKVDATVAEKTAKRFGVDGYPTLKWFANGKDSEYGGGRTADTITSWIMKKTGPASEEIKCEDIAKTVGDNKISLILYGAQDTEMGKAFIQVAKANDKVSFYHTTADCADGDGYKIADSEPVKATKDGLALFKNFDTPIVGYTGKANDADIEAFIKANSVAQLFKFSDDSVEAIFHNSTPAIVYFTDGEATDAFKAASKAMKGKILFSWSGVSEGIQEQLGEFVGVTKEDMPCIRIIKPKEQGVEKYKYEGAMADATEESISAFVKSWESGSLKPFRKSEVAPADNSGPVRTLVSTNWEADVIKSTNEVLVKFYAPWCGHCTALAPHWTKLGEAVKGVNGLVIGKYDATKNENEGVEVESFPTLKFYQKGVAMDVKYNHEEGKQAASLQNFLRKNSAAYKAARPDEKIEADDFKEEEPAKEGEEGPDGGEGDMGEGDGKDMPEGDMPEGEEGKDAEFTEEQMKEMEGEMEKMTPEEKEKMKKEMEGADAPGGEPVAEAAGDAKKEDL